jgi:hypothetical protein
MGRDVLCGAGTLAFGQSFGKGLDEGCMKRCLRFGMPNTAVTQGG